MGSASRLRAELIERAGAFAVAHSLPHCLSYAEQPTVCFEAFGVGQHGNFHPSSYKRIAANHAWRARLQKVHTTAGRQLPRSESGRRRRELDTCTSSDALLMNVFCHPGVGRCKEVSALLGITPGLVPEFGFRARVPLSNGGVDRTEMDMRIGNLLVEAKLTEGDFQRTPKNLARCYRDFADVFEENQLPQTEREYTSYQLIRGFLAAYATGNSYCLIADARRPDLIEIWYSTLKCVTIFDLRLRCKILTWQELGQAAPAGLKRFLAEKYGL